MSISKEDELRRNASVWVCGSLWEHQSKMPYKDTEIAIVHNRFGILVRIQWIQHGQLRTVTSSQHQLHAIHDTGLDVIYLIHETCEKAMNMQRQ